MQVLIRSFHISYNVLDYIHDNNFQKMQTHTYILLEVLFILTGPSTNSQWTQMPTFASKVNKTLENMHAACLFSWKT